MSYQVDIGVAHAPRIVCAEHDKLRDDLARIRKSVARVITAIETHPEAFADTLWVDDYTTALDELRLALGDAT